MCNENNAVETIEYKGKTIKIYLEDDAPNPREDYDNFGHMICFHRRYTLGDKHDFSVEDVQELIKDENTIWLPIYAYEHGNITISCGRGYPYNDMWDSGQLGIIYVTKEEIRKEYSCKRITNKTLQNVVACLRAEVETYDQYLTGDVYGYDIEDTDESCWGFFGMKSAIEEAKSTVDYLVKEELQYAGDHYNI